VGLAERCSVESLDPRVELAGSGRQASETKSVGAPWCSETRSPEATMGGLLGARAPVPVDEPVGWTQCPWASEISYFYGTGHLQLGPNTRGYSFQS